ncbi:hypothetical protein, partial [Providencia sp.]|uniref:hypothetical protein n=1 Tax=Providencia sp. TaxID=589 RepID=UPI003341632B
IGDFFNIFGLFVALDQFSFGYVVNHNRALAPLFLQWHYKLYQDNTPVLKRNKNFCGYLNWTESIVNNACKTNNILINNFYFRISNVNTGANYGSE